ncbi:g6018 [Coccomyxa viridis]|uniref:G6018 protein n=1 Tax=Coccomyxa viridis TaxID=1274662 RepID=A0ABP1FZF6_9CHLO
MEEDKREVNVVTLFQKAGLQSHDSSVDPEELRGVVVGLYFSAHWCPPCRQFTPLLKQAYHAINASGKRLEIVFVSSDHDEKQFEDYFKSMPWLAVPFSARAAQAAMASRFKVQGIPALVLIEDGEVVNASARGAVMKDPTGAAFPWKGQEDQAGGGGPNWYLIIAAVAFILLKYVFKVI